MALCLSDGPNGPRHSLIGHSQESVGYLVYTQVLASLLVDLVRQLLEHRPACFRIQALVFILAKYLGEELGQQTAEVEISVRDGGGAAFAVAGGARVCSGGLGADDEEAVAEEEPGAATGRNSVDIELGRLNSDTSRCRLEDMLIPALSIS